MEPDADVGEDQGGPRAPPTSTRRAWCDPGTRRRRPGSLPSRSRNRGLTRGSGSGSTTTGCSTTTSSRTGCLGRGLDDDRWRRWFVEERRRFDDGRRLEPDAPAPPADGDEADADPHHDEQGEVTTDHGH